MSGPGVGSSIIVYGWALQACMYRGRRDITGGAAFEAVLFGVSGSLGQIGVIGSLVM